MHIVVTLHTFLPLPFNVGGGGDGGGALDEFINDIPRLEQLKPKAP